MASPRDRFADQTARGGDAARAGDVVSALFGERGARALSAAQRAAQAWYAANGDRERAHTTGVWLRKSGHAGVDPVLVVEVDSGLLAGELGTNKDIYLQRLAFRGVQVSDIRFSVGRRREGSAPGAPPGSAARAAGGAADKARPPRPLTAEEEARVERATAALPERLRERAAWAMRASLRKEKGRRDAEGRT